MKFIFKKNRACVVCILVSLVKYYDNVFYKYNRYSIFLLFTHKFVLKKKRTIFLLSSRDIE